MPYPLQDGMDWKREEETQNMLADVRQIKVESETAFTPRNIIRWITRERVVILLCFCIFGIGILSYFMIGVAQTMVTLVDREIAQDSIRAKAVVQINKNGSISQEVKDSMFKWHYESMIRYYQFKPANDSLREAGRMLLEVTKPKKPNLQKVKIN